MLLSRPVLEAVGSELIQTLKLGSVGWGCTHRTCYKNYNYIIIVSVNWYQILHLVSYYVMPSHMIFVFIQCSGNQLVKHP